jgi:hypothetical protein
MRWNNAILRQFFSPYGSTRKHEDERFRILSFFSSLPLSGDSRRAFTQAPVTQTQTQTQTQTNRDLLFFIGNIRERNNNSLLLQSTRVVALSSMFYVRLNLMSDAKKSCHLILFRTPPPQLECIFILVQLLMLRTVIRAIDLHYVLLIPNHF